MARGLIGSGGGSEGSRETGMLGAEAETGLGDSVAAAAEPGGILEARMRSGWSGVTVLMDRPWTLDRKLERRLVADGLSMARSTSGAVLVALSGAAGAAGWRDAG